MKVNPTLLIKTFEKNEKKYCIFHEIRFTSSINFYFKPVFVDKKKPISSSHGMNSEETSKKEFDKK